MDVSSRDDYQSVALIPGLLPPPNVTSNFNDPESLAPATRSVICVALALMYCFLIVRIYTRLRVTCSFGADDLLCLASAAAITAYCAFVLSKLGNPLGPHQWNVPLVRLNSEEVQLVLPMLVTTSLYFVASSLLKTALLIFYLRIFRPSKRARTLICASIGVIIPCYVIGFAVNVAKIAPNIQRTTFPDTTTITNTTQISADYASTPVQNGCATPQVKLSAAMGVFSMVTDFYVLAIPVILVPKVQLPPTRKFGVCAILLTGLLACSASLVTCVYRFKLLHSSDCIWFIVLVYITCTIELNVGIMCSCMPIGFVVLNGLNKRISDSFAKFISTHSKNNNPSNPSMQKGTSERDHFPKIPSGAITGLRSFIRKAHSSQTDRTFDMSTYNELNSIDETYHGHLERGQGNSPLRY
ncbi:hypothetical protein F5B20DRAFT_218899 [Whalleya microplaca]|nr:hypothetical protein F5B20DRAFT_218899 [Whalleya microplaca]